MCNDLILNPEILRKVNSATKYPSILTYHNLGNKGSFLLLFTSEILHSL